MRILWITVSALIAFPVLALDLQGKAGAEALLFKDAPKYEQQKQQYYSVSLELEAFQAVSNDSEIKAKLFSRLDSQVDTRTHSDIRELMFYRYADEWEINAGIGKVFWGTTETRHLVDIVNQVDWVESLDDEARLGQSMVMGKLIKEWGTLDLLILPYFREIQFTDQAGRPSFQLPVETNAAVYQSKDEAHHIDYAVRWSHTLGDADIGLSYFNGTQRQPLFNAISANDQLALQPVYVQTQQLGLDAQYILGDALWKLEGVYRDSHKADFSGYQSTAVVAGLEFTLVGVFETAYDLGLIAEYQYDEWKNLTPFQNDFVAGVRWVLNDEQTTEVLLTHAYDLEYGSQNWLITASRRVGDRWKVEGMARVLGEVGKKDDFLQTYRKEDLVSISLFYYF